MATRMDRHKQNDQANKKEKQKKKDKTNKSTPASIEEQPKKKKHKKIWYVLGIIIVLLALFLGKIYLDAKNTVNNMQQEAGNSESLKQANQNVRQGKPISILLLGTDDGALDRASQGGLTDTMMVMTLNPSKKSGVMMSLERDSYVDIAGQGTKAKLNSAYSYGVDTAIQTVEQLLNIPIDFYATINMQGLQDLVNAVGGVTVDSNIAFTFDGYTFEKGPNKIETGAEALAFTRMRKEDPEGDYGRQRRQRALVNAIMKKMGSITSIAHYKEILDTVQKNMKTDMSWSTMVALGTKYRRCFNNMENDYLHGTDFMQDGISYQDISGDLSRVQSVLQQSLAE